MRSTKPVIPPQECIKSFRGLEDENRRLRDEVYILREILIGLMDPQGMLHGYRTCDDFDQFDEWRQKTAAAIIKNAWVRPGSEMGDPRWPRAICPLCRGGAQSVPDVQGFAVPAGLRRHLLGELNSRQCPVFAAAEQIAQEGARRSEMAKRRPG
jgi:hypothetical protein